MAKSFPNTGATVIDSAADLPAASAALEGILMFQKDTNELKICDGSSWVSVVDTDTPPAMQLINPTSVVNATNSAGNVNFSAQTTVSVNGVFSNSYTNYRIIVDSTSSNVYGYNVYFRLRTSGIDNSSTVYATSFIYSSNTGGPSRLYNSGQAQGVVMNTGDLGGFAVLDVFRPNMAARTGWSFTSGGWGTSANEQITGSGLYNDNTIFDGFTLYPYNSNFTGSIRVYGYRNSI